tara:strand:+ start:736 stop:957 length:222 start_codon:yes stop_codon:yes gene_type:complete
MKKYNFKQVQKSLESIGFKPSRSFGDEFECLTIFERSTGTQYGWEFANVEECLEDGTCTINGLCPAEWGKIYK